MSTNKNHRQVTWAEATRDVLVNSMTKGQLPLLGVIGVVLLMLWKTPTTYFPQLWEKVLSGLVSWWLWGYIVAIVELLVLIFGARLFRSVVAKELRRVGQEKTKLQNIAGGTRYESSERN
jgi:hypothetical protein